MLLRAILERTVLLCVDRRDSRLDLKRARLLVVLIIYTCNDGTTGGCLGAILGTAVDLLVLLLLLSANSRANRTTAHAQVGVLRNKAVHLLEAVLGPVPVVRQ